MSAALAWLPEEEEFAMAEDEFRGLVKFLRSSDSRKLNHAELRRCAQ